MEDEGVPEVPASASFCACVGTRGSVVSTNTGSATFIEDLPMPAAFGVAFPEKRDPLKYRTTWSRVM
ncbi:MAG: hypothetical protein DMF66_18260 [Acidobacteria bacterium]|nr:MAG: hypothetical protein DMF66_18260 [Acidobacteriota bacterium]